jgi:hypothetical protein
MRNLKIFIFSGSIDQLIDSLVTRKHTLTFLLREEIHRPKFMKSNTAIDIDFPSVLLIRNVRTHSHSIVSDILRLSDVKHYYSTGLIFFLSS